MTDIEHPTPTLRFVRRPYGPWGPTERSVKLILQQQWLIWDDNQIARYEWRDVPVEDENENKTPTDPAAT